MNLLLWTIAFIGHIGLWCVVYNRTHATSWPRKIRKRCEYLAIAMVLLMIGWGLTRVVLQKSANFWDVANSGIAERLYLVGTVFFGSLFIARWCWRKFSPVPSSLVSRKCTLIDVQKELGENLYCTTLGRVLKRVPLNQSHLIAVEELTLGVRRLPEQLDGLKICHLSDFHFTGQLDQKYFHRIIDEANAFEPDLILITGDLIDEFSCLDWIEPLFGRLVPKHSTWFVRGNHDMRIVDQKMLLDRLEAANMNWLGGKCESIELRGIQISLCGNELPWFSGAESLNPRDVDSNSLRILLTHSPDQIDWVQENEFEFDLILAGHNHGGQIALPVVGPIVAPSKYGVLYASGTFEIGNATMHVSRGISGDECIRINCPPEIGCITLTSIAGSSKNSISAAT